MNRYQHKIKKSLLLLFVLSTISIMSISTQSNVSALGAPITGTVWLDINSDTQQSAPEYTPDQGFEGVTVTAYDAANNSSSDVSDVNGEYSIDVSTLGAGPFRVELSVPYGYKSAPLGNDSGLSISTETTVRQKVDAGSDHVNFAIIDPSTYCAANPKLLVACFANGDARIADASASSTSSKIALRSFLFEDEGYVGSPGYNAPNEVNTAGDIGTVYGVGYSRKTKSAYLGSFMRRHTAFGPGGSGAIYVTDPGTGVISSTINIADAGTEPSPRDLAGVTSQPSHDTNAFAMVGKIGLGDVDVVGDGNTLFTVNLNTRELVRVDNLDATPSISTYALDPNVTCPGGPDDKRPFGLGSRKIAGSLKVYVGITCSGQTNNLASDMVFDVAIFDVDTNTWEGSALSAPASLDYPKGCAMRASSAFYNLSLGCSWHPWSDDPNDAETIDTNGLFGFMTVSYSQAILSDIEFDQTGAMVLAFGDRGGWQWGHRNYAPNAADSRLYNAFAAGDQLRLCGSSGSYVLENNSSCGATTTNGAGNGQGPGGGEFYWGDSIGASDPAFPNVTSAHDEVGLGAFAYVPGRTTMAATITDPFYSLNGNTVFHGDSVGVARLAHNDDPSIPAQAGGWVAAYEFGRFLGTGSPLHEAASSTNSFGKAGNLGDLEALCDNAPLEIGNYVWFDTDNDGIQDPDELAIEGVTVHLRNSSGAVIATAVTDAQGHYLFASEGTNNVLINSWDGTGPGDDDITDFIGIVQDPTGDLNDGEYGISEDSDYSIVFDMSSAVITPQLNTLGINTASDFYLTTVKATSPGSNAPVRDSDADLLDGNFTIALTTGNAGNNDHTFDVGFYSSPTTTTTTTTTTIANKVNTTYTIAAPKNSVGSNSILAQTGFSTAILVFISIAFISIGIIVVRKAKLKRKLI